MQGNQNVQIGARQRDSERILCVCRLKKTVGYKKQYKKKSE
jgi:hypothetical protein